MAGKLGPEPKSVGQRSISSMFSNAGVTAGRSGSGGPLPLMEFLDRKSEKRASIQGCVIDAGLTLEVRERLDAIRKNDTRSNKPYEKNESSHGLNDDLTRTGNSQSLRSEGLQVFSVPKATAAGVGIVEEVTFRQGNDVGQCSVEEWSTSSCQEETPISKHCRWAQVYAESSSSRLGESMQEKVVSQVLDGSKNRVQTPPRFRCFCKHNCLSFAVDTGFSLANFQVRHDLDGDLHKKASHHYQSRSVDFIDLTEGEDPVLARLEGEDHFNKNTELHRKRKRPQVLGTAEMCPICDEIFPHHMLQAHVESELGALEMLETNSALEAHATLASRNEPHNIGHEDVDAGAWEDRANFPVYAECSAQVTNFRPKQSLLVLGDEPKHRRQRGSRSHVKKRPTSSATFNYYADGAGWWDEGGVGVDAEAVGSASVWEGLGSMSFGGML